MLKHLKSGLKVGKKFMDITKTKNIYMIGIKGVGMTMLAQYLSGQNIEVIGSDTEEKFMTDKVLQKAGIKVIEKFNANNIPNGVDLIIYSSAYNAENNVEVAKALTEKIKVMTYAQAMGEVFNQKRGIAVIGSHGKTTITAWLGYVMEKAGLKPSVMVGAQVSQLNGCGIIGESDYLVIEADEYQNKLKYFQPKAVLLNNIDYDHPDFFPTKDDYKNVFIEFIKKIPAKGFLIANFDDPIIRKIVAKCNCKIISYAINQNNKADCLAYDVRQNNGKQYFKVKMGVENFFSEGKNIVEDETSASRLQQYFQKKGLGNFCIRLSGKHNISNALAVIAACVELGIDLPKIKKYLEEFTGTARRMQIMGKFNNAIIIDDYAHHPTEIKVTLAGARELYKSRKIIAVFHPHTFSRTKALLNDFAKSFESVDEVIVLDIYGSARERRGGVHSRDLVKKIGIRNKGLEIRQDIKYISTLGKCKEYLKENIKKGDVVLLMGAGDIFRIGESLVKSS